MFPSLAEISYILERSNAPPAQHDPRSQGLYSPIEIGLLRVYPVYLRCQECPPWFLDCCSIYITYACTVNMQDTREARTGARTLGDMGEAEHIQSAAQESQGRSIVDPASAT